MSRYDTVKKISDKKITRIGTADLPKFEEDNSDILLIAVHGDKCDMISQQYYGTTDYWWYIALVNNLTSNNIEAGTQVRVPTSIDGVLLE
tara:strand:+ start:539 stop:808 length:270 start_codon:yes stop_codon:yes gene_type:complete